MGGYPTYKITIVVAPDRQDMTEEEIREWVETVVRGIGAVAEIEIEKTGDGPS